MINQNLRIFRGSKDIILDEKEKTFIFHPQIYSQRKSSDSPGDFRFKRARKINQ